MTNTDDVQYIATHDFMDAMLGNRDDLPENILDIMYENYDLMVDPGMEEPEYRKSYHRDAEYRFRKEYEHRQPEINTHASQLAAKNPGRKLPAGYKVPYYLIAMALRQTATSKRRVILTDDPGLIEILHACGIEVLESDDFIQKMRKDHLLPEQQEKQSAYHQALDRSKRYAQHLNIQQSKRTLKEERELDSDGDIDWMDDDATKVDDETEDLHSMGFGDLDDM